jgi:lipopolysaccharide export system permease protein
VEDDRALMRRLDAYLLRRFLADACIGMACVFALYVVLDLSTNLGRFLDAGRSRPAAFIAAYYLFRFPLLFGKLCPLVLLLGASFSLTLLERRNELVPIKASGIGMVRFTRPLVLCGLAAALLGLAVEEWAVPWAAREVVRRNLERSDSNLWNQLVRDEARSQYVFYNVYYPAQRRMERVHVSRVDAKMREREVLYAEEATFSRSEQAWTLHRGTLIRYDEKGLREGTPEAFDARRLETDLLPTDMENRARPDEMPLSGLRAAWAAHPSISSLGARFHFRAALPFANVLILLVGLPVVLSGARKRFFLGALATALLGGAYLALSYGALQLGVSGALPPVLAGWGPAILFSAAAAAAYDLMPS